MCHVLFPAAHRGRGLRRPAVSVQEEEREAHRRGDAASGSARYGQAEASQLGSGVTAGTVFGNQSSFCCLATKNGHSPSCFQLGRGGQINTDQKFFIAASLIHE